MELQSFSGRPYQQAMVFVFSPLPQVPWDSYRYSRLFRQLPCLFFSFYPRFFLVTRYVPLHWMMQPMWGYVGFQIGAANSRPE